MQQNILAIHYRRGFIFSSLTLCSIMNMVTTWPSTEGNSSNIVGKSWPFTEGLVQILYLGHPLKVNSNIVSWPSTEGLVQTLYLGHLLRVSSNIVGKSWPSTEGLVQILYLGHPLRASSNIVYTGGGQKKVSIIENMVNVV